MLTDSSLYTDEEVFDIINDRDESIVNIVRQNYDNLVNNKNKITRTDIFKMVSKIVDEIHGVSYKKAKSENIFRVVIKEGKKEAYDFREVPAYKIAMISDIRMKVFYNLNGQEREMQIDKYQLHSIEPLF